MHHLLFRASSVLLGLSFVLTARGQWSDPWVHQDPHEVRLPVTWEEPEEGVQRHLRRHTAWAEFHEANPRWQVVFDASSRTVLRAFGPALATDAPEAWFDNLLQGGMWEVAHSDWQEHAMGKHTLYHAAQTVEGRPVLGTQLMVKAGEAGVVSWGAKVHASATWPELNSLELADLESAAVADLTLANMTFEAGEEVLVPLKRLSGEQTRFDFRPALTCTVQGLSEQGVPVIYSTLVDLENGAILMRDNTVRHVGGHRPEKKSPRPVQPMGPPALLQMLSCQVTGTVHLTQPFEPTTEVGLGYLQAQTAAGAQATDVGGMLTLDGGPQELGLQLFGLYSTVTTNGVTPDVDLSVNGDTTISLDEVANLRELSAYHSVNRIHDHMQAWLPDFTGLDFSLPTLVDVSGTCNAFYTPGSPTINFFSEGDGCTAFSLVSDVVFHEYGHGINDVFYESLGGAFTNGATNEGYADFWAISLSENPVLGAGCFSDDPEQFIRRYDENPKVYPQDLVGEVHADGEIICGAWYDTHLLMGGDWNQTLNLFVDAFPGLQAQAANGNEGEVYVEILLDVLQADDDNNDLSDGTPNGAAILEGFGLHGISLFSSVDIAHNPAMFGEADASISVEAGAEILFPFGQYFSTCDLYYRTSAQEAWTVVPMTEEGGDLFSAQIPAQPAGTVVDYHFGISDLFGATSAITPYSADDAANPNLPFNLIVGLEPVLTDDQDDASEFGFWSFGLPEDNATTGEWESTIPVGSFSTPGDPSSICAPDEDHTPGDGLYAFITGVSPGPDAGIGSNDVDGGSTTLLSESIDLSDMVSPVLSYWRWYVNAPATGANPGTDWWQVHLSDDGGNSWVEVEETLTQDISWRRNAIALSDFIDLTDDVQLRFVASDSLRLDQELDGGSLIEAAVDDLVILDVVASDISETSPSSGIVAWPVPASDRIHAAGWQPGSQVLLLTTDGKRVAEGQADALGQVHFEVPSGLSGMAHLKGTGRSGQVWVKKVMLLKD